MTPLLVILLVFVGVLTYRGVDARLRLEDAAHQAARAASLERSGPAAAHAAQSTARGALAAAGIICESLDIDTTMGGFVPGGTVTVTVSCTVDAADRLLPGSAGRKRLSATAIEPVDTWRGATLRDRGLR